MNNTHSKEGKKGMKKLNNIPGKRLGKKKRATDCIKFKLNITDFSVLDDTILSKKYPIYFGKTPHIAIPRIRSITDDHHKTGAPLKFNCKGQTTKETESNRNLTNSFFSRVSSTASEENVQIQKTQITTKENTSNIEATKSKSLDSEKHISDSDNQNNTSNNIVTELDVTKLKLTFKNLINHRSSVTSGDDTPSREQSGSKLPAIRGSSIQDVIRNNTDVGSHKQLGKDLSLNSDPDNLNKENEKLIRTLEHKTDNTCTILGNSCSQNQDSVNTQACTTENASSNVTSSPDEIDEKTLDNNCELPVLANITKRHLSTCSQKDPSPPILTPANDRVTSTDNCFENSLSTEQLNQSREHMLNDKKEEDTYSRQKPESTNTCESTRLKVYVVEECTSLDESSKSKEIVSINPHSNEQSVEICQQAEGQIAESNSNNQTVVEVQEQLKDSNNIEHETDNQNSNNSESLKDCESLNNDGNVLMKKPKPKIGQKAVVKQEPFEIIRKPLNQHDGYDSDATMIYDEDEKNDSRCLPSRSNDMGSLKIKQTQQLLRLKSKIVQSTDEQELEKSPETIECIESLYPSFRGENLDKSEDVSSKLTSSNEPESRDSIRNSDTISTENTPLPLKENELKNRSKPIHKIRICMKKTKNKNSKHHHIKREKHKPSEIQLKATKWDQAISGPDNVILTDLTISRGIVKNSSHSKTNKKCKKHRDRNSETGRRNENKKRRDSQDMVLKNINKIFPKPRRKRPKDEDDLPTILPPKRRRQGKGNVTPDSKTDMDRIKHEFPHFNWLEKKYTDKQTVDIVADDTNNQSSKTTLQNVTPQSEDNNTTDDLQSICQSNEIDTSLALEPITEKNITQSSQINPEEQSQANIMAEPPSNEIPAAEPCSTENKQKHTEDDEHMPEDEPVLVIDESINNANGNLIQSSADDVITTTASSIIYSPPVSQALSSNLSKTPFIDTSVPNDRNDDISKSFNSKFLIQEKESSTTGMDVTAVQEIKSKTVNEVTTGYPFEHTITVSNCNPSFGSFTLGSNQISPSVVSAPNVISNVHMTSGNASVSDSLTFVAASDKTVVSSIYEKDEVMSNNISIQNQGSVSIEKATVISNNISIQKQGSVAISSVTDTTTSISSTRNTSPKEVPTEQSLAHEPVTKKVKVDGEITKMNTEIPPLIPFSSSSKQGKPFNNRNKLFDPEIEETYNEIKQLKRELEIKNQEVGRMMLSLKEKEEKLRSLLLSSTLGKSKNHTSSNETNFSNDSAVTTSVCTKQPLVSTGISKSSSLVTNVGAHIDLYKTPPPAHVCKKENTKEILRTLAANPVKVPLDIKATCPFKSRQRPLSPPLRLRKDGYEGKLQAAHAQKPFEIPGMITPMTNERSKSQGSEVNSKADVYTTRALSAPVQDHHLVSPINLHHTSRCDSIGAINNPISDKHIIASSSSIHVPFSTQNDISSRQQPVNKIIEPLNQSIITQKTIVPPRHEKQNAETAIQQELNEALKRRQNFEQRPEQQDYQQFKISKPQSLNHIPPRQIFQNSTVDNIDTEYQKRNKIMHGVAANTPVSTFGIRPSVHALSKSGQSPQYSGELINVLQRTTQNTEMVNGRMNTTSVSNVSHAQLPNRVRLIGAATVPMSNNGRLTEPNRVLPNNLYQQQQQQLQHLTSHSGVRPQSIPRQQVASIPSSVSQQVYQQKAHKEGAIPYPSQIPLHIQQTLQSSQQMAVPNVQHRLTAPQTINPSQMPPPRMQQLLQAHPGQQMNGRPQEGCNPAMLDTKMKEMISGHLVQRPSNILTQQDGNSKAHHIFGSCILCGKFSLYLCSTCQNIWYCSQQCQLKHWTTHQHECKFSTGK